MKLFTTAAMALALTGAAAAAYADNPNDQKGEQHQAQPHGGQGGGQQHGGQGGGQHNAGAAQGGPQHFNGQAVAGAHGAPVQGGAGQGGVQRFNGQAFQRGQGQGGPGQGGAGQGGAQRFNGQAFQRGQGQGGPGQGQVQGGQRFNGQAVQGGGQQWQGRGQQQWQGQNGQVQRWNGGQGGQRFNGQGGAGGGFGFQNHALRGRDQGRSYYSANSFARQYRAQRQFRFGGYRNFPSGWSYRPWYFGEFLPLGWYTSQYYLDWADYGLPPPPVGCEWIAEGPDAVLVDVWTGEVLSVYQGVFYWNAY